MKRKLNQNQLNAFRSISCDQSPSEVSDPDRFGGGGKFEEYEVNVAYCECSSHGYKPYKVATLKSLRKRGYIELYEPSPYESGKLIRCAGGARGCLGVMPHLDANGVYFAEVTQAGYEYGVEYDGWTDHDPKSYRQPPRTNPTEPESTDLVCTLEF